ncbi:glycosyltransferase family 4 protein [Roseateles sp.]|uniref:glycosyltransferase family 4 protein n=1 Tax=Roseateles sp. TaxID=1971397 RepID=UPI003BA6A6F1
MKIVVAHNAYQHRGGEDMVVEAEVAMLRAAGHEVELLERNNHDLAHMSRLSAAAQTFWSASTTDAVRDLAQRFKPDVMHVHNTFPLLSPSLYWACAAAGIPVVQTLHNFRLGCPQAMFLRDGVVCESCIGRFPLPAIKHGCYRGSRAQTAVLSGMLALHRGLGTWQNKVTRFIALNEFCRNKFVQMGLPAERLVIKPNFVDAPPFFDGAQRKGFLFVGRLSPEKGVQTLAHAWQKVPKDAWLKVAGTGPESARLDGVARVEVLGSQSQVQIQSHMAAAMALVLPSIWYENFPRTLVEALAAGLPVIASRIGALADLVRDGETGLLFNPGDSDDLSRVLTWAAQHPQEMAQMGRQARIEYEAHYTPQKNLAQLLAIYEEAIRAA